jgi:hypothetical protein
LSTDHANGSDYIYFNLDDQLLKGGRNHVMVKVTYLDSHTGQWRLEYDAGPEAAWKRSRPVLNIGDGKFLCSGHAMFKFPRWQNMVEPEPPMR